MADLSDILLADLRAGKKTVNRLLSAGITFVLLGHFYVLEPYFELKAEERAAAAEFETGREELARFERQLAEVRAAGERAGGALADIKRRVHAFPDDLRDMLPRIAQAVDARAAAGGGMGAGASSPAPAELQANQTLQMPQPEPSFNIAQQTAPPPAQGLALPPGVTGFEDGVHWYIEDWFARLTADLRERVVEPLLELKEQEFRIELADLHPMADEAMAKLRELLGSLPPGFWRVYSGRDASKTGVAQHVEEEVSEAFDPMMEEVSRLLEKVERDISRQEARSAQAEDRLQAVEALSVQFEKRLSSLESPLGRLPLGLTELITLFPLLLVVLALMSAGAIHKSAGLYLGFRAELERQGKEAGASALKQFADCWYLPPYRSLLEPAALAAAFLVTAVVFARAAWLVIGEDTLFTSVAGEPETLKRDLFAGAYAAGGLLVLGSAGFAGWSLRRTARAL